MSELGWYRRRHIAIKGAIIWTSTYAAIVLIPTIKMLAVGEMPDGDDVGLAVGLYFGIGIFGYPTSFAIAVSEETDWRRRRPDLARELDRIQRAY